ncbi:MAG: hypothetical protein Q8Q67_02320 [bacterium]|nr:hypothetical protein [bacterium]
MKTMLLIRESKGLLAFIAIYVLVRLLLCLPVMAIQDETTITIVLAAIAISWVIFEIFMDERKGMFLAFALLATAVFAYFSFEVFTLQEAKYAIWAVMASTALIGLLSFVSVMRTDKKVALMLALGTAAILIVLFGIEFIISMLY